MKQNWGFVGVSAIFIGLTGWFGYRFGQVSVDLEAACPDYTRKARAAQVEALNIAEDALEKGEQCLRALQECEARRGIYGQTGRL